MQRLLWIAAGLLLLASCTSVPDGVKPVENFDADRYLGNWYEIARLPHSFEEGLSNVTATYTLRDDGGINVLNKGFNDESGEWEEAEGKAYFVENPSIGYLKVSFFGPFYASYVVVSVDESYRYALVSGPDRSYLWVLSRTKTLAPDTLDSLVDKAEALGYDVSQLIYVNQDKYR
ncbi:lipocalin family protein [Alteromonas sp. C1M14]|uniref:lipocalin family protein n=1 Tax=Alteromonas sp. C1M14 TaxID=2841567 RepID=UPI001C092908|nr:lipocalin family protein [Alteromonas sp. C1M14]MBU2980156.1 lipocalin family protein [Alteromonas sp. C1M14]